MRQFVSLFPFLFSLCCAWAHPTAAATPAQHYTDLCAVCHLPGINGAPKVGDKEDWSQRVRAGMAMVYRNALEGMPNTAMMAKGGHRDLSEAQLKAIVDYMISATELYRGVLGEAWRYDKLGITDRDFIRRDTNFDGYLSRQELQDDPVLLRNFARFDRNRDDRLSEAEFREADRTLVAESAAVQMEDAALASAVRSALDKVKGIDLQYTKIDVKAGTVVMIGMVDHARIAIRAHDVVKRIDGVRNIDNRLVSGHQIGWD